MPANHLAAADAGGKIRDILQLDQAALRVVARHDLEAIEVRAAATGHPPTVIVLAPEQALVLAERLVGAVLGVAGRMGR